MGEKNKKDTGSKKGLLVLFGIIDVVLVVLFVLTFFISGGLGKEIKSNLSKDFKENADTYGETDSEAEYSSDTNIFFNGTSISTSKQEAQTEDNTTQASEFVFPNSDKELLTDEQIQAAVKDKPTLRRAINEIYARHGYQFTTEENIQYFNQFDWYKNLTKEPDMNKVSATFSNIETKNVEKLQAYSDANGWS